MKVILLTIVLVTAITSAFFPWIGVIAYYTLAVAFPQAIWFWIFKGFRAAYYITVTTMAGLGIKAITGNIDFSLLKDRQNIFIIVVWLSALVSYYFSPMGHNKSTYRALDSEYLVTNFSKELLFYFVAVILIDDSKKLKKLAWVLAITTIFYTYWGNMQYLSGSLSGGRLKGPGMRGIYTDENTFAMLFVCGIPFLFYLARSFRRFWLKGAFLLIIPLAWHAIFLTQSRGGLVGIGCVTLYIALRSKKKMMGLAMIPVLIAALIWQGGSIKNRVQIVSSNYEDDGSTMGRIHSWTAGSKMVLDHPITGVGLGNYLPAFPMYSEERPRVAHNTVIQFAAETGAAAGLAYLALIFNVFIQGRKVRRESKKRNYDPTQWAIFEASECSLFGFFICSLFLNLAMFEVYYYLLMIHMASVRMMLSEGTETSAEESIAAQETPHAVAAKS
jgi:putative inorganic carbon (hco3(-)) transporter